MTFADSVFLSSPALSTGPRAPQVWSSVSVALAHVKLGFESTAVVLGVGSRLKQKESLVELCAPEPQAHSVFMAPLNTHRHQDLDDGLARLVRHVFHQNKSILV